MSHKISIEELAGENQNQEYKTLLASSSEDKKQLFHVLEVDKEFTATYFLVVLDGLKFQIDGIYNAIRFYNKDGNY